MHCGWAPLELLLLSHIEAAPWDLLFYPQDTLEPEGHVVTKATALLHDLNSKKANRLTLSPLGEPAGEAPSTIPRPGNHPSRNPTQAWEMPQTLV